MNKILTFLFAVLFAGCGSVSAANDYYNPTGSPAYKSADSSATMRAEFAAIGDGFDILPTMTGNGGEIVVVNGGETALETETVDSVVGATKTEITTLTDGSDSSALHNHTTANLNDTTATGANLNTLTDTSDASSLHSHTTANLNDTTATGANLNTLTDTSDASSLHNHTTANLSDTTATGANLNTLTDGSNADTLHAHALVNVESGTNLLINPNFIVNQEGYVDNANLTSIGSYAYDMWMSTTGTGENGVSVSGENITLEAVASFEQINDDLIANSGKVGIISIDSGTVDVSGGGITGTQTLTSSTAYSFTLAVTSSDGIVVAYESPGTFSGLKLEIGTTATNYQIPLVAEEKDKCFRYYYVFGTSGLTLSPAAAFSSTTDLMEVSLKLPVEMSSTPSASLAGFNAYGGGSTSYSTGGSSIVVLDHQNGVVIFTLETWGVSLTLNHSFALDLNEFELSARY